jgi:Protein of unknown function (DUF3592)
MLIIVGAWFAVAGGLAVLAGLAGRWRSRRLRSAGSPVWARIVAGPVPPWPPDGSPVRPMLQYMLADGQMMERIAPGRARKAGRLRPGQPVLIWYDPADPDDILVFGHEGRAANIAFVITGLLLILTGGWLALGR